MIDLAYEHTRESNLREDVCTLITPIVEQDANGVNTRTGMKEVEVFCKVGSIYMKEVYTAYEAGIQPGWRLKVMQADYNGETVVRFDGDLYAVYRSFCSNDEVELYIRKDVNVWEAGLLLA